MSQALLGVNYESGKFFAFVVYILVREQTINKQNKIIVDNNRYYKEK